MSDHHYKTINHGNVITRRRTNIDTLEWELLICVRRPYPGDYGLNVRGYAEPPGRDVLTLQEASEPHFVKRTKDFIVARQVGRPL